MAEETEVPRVQQVRQSEDRFLASDVFEARSRALPPRNGTGFYSEASRDIPIYQDCDVLVVGGGPSGTAAALAAARAGADVVMLERYNHLGGLSTGGLVIWIDRMTDWTGRQVIRGFADEVFDRMPKEGVAGPPREQWGSRDPAHAGYWGMRTSAFHGVVCWAPTIDPERLKLLSQELLLEAGVRLVFHSWAAVPIVQDGAVKGVVFESKAGRQALMAKVVVDATGDGDMFARAGAGFDTDIEEGDVHHSANTSFMLGGVDMTTWLDFRKGSPEQFAAFTALGRETLRLLPDALRFVAQRYRPVPGAAPVGPVRAGRGRHDRAGDPLAPLHADALRFLPRERAGVRALLHAAERLATWRAAYAAAGRRRPDRAEPVGRRYAGVRRGGGQPVDLAQISGRLGALRVAGAAQPGRAGRMRPPRLVRCQQPRLHA